MILSRSSRAMGPILPQSMPVVIETGLSTYKFFIAGRVDGAAIKTAISGVMLAQPCKMILYHRGYQLTDDDRDLRVESFGSGWRVTSDELRLRLDVTIFIPK